MAKEKKDTEERIFEAACRVFHRKGYAGTHMQQIADEADINKSMLHYYYRSKDKLFQKVYQEGMSQFFPVLIELLDAEIPLDEKVEQIIGIYYSFLNDNPRMSQFIITEMNHNPERFKDFIKKSAKRPPEKFFYQIRTEIEKGHMSNVDPRQFWISLVGLILFPFHGRTMIETLFDMNDDDYAQFLEERKKMLSTFILNAINYSRT